MVDKIQDAMMKYSKLFLGDDQDINMEGFASGHIFYRMLLHAQGFRFGFGEFEQNPSNWIHKLSNIKTIVKKISHYFETKVDKGIKTNDINLLQIAKNNRKSEIIKLFQIVLATLTQSPNKQQHIGKIMSLDQGTQTNFVSIIQKVIENRMLEVETYRRDKEIYLMQQLQFQNSLLRKQIDSIFQQKSMLEEQLQQLKSNIQGKQVEMAEIMDKVGIDCNDKNYVLTVHNEQMKNMVENLKNKLIQNTHKHQIQVYRLNQQISILNNRIRKLEQVQQTLYLYKEKYDEIHYLEKDNKRWQKQLVRANRQMTQKDSYIKKLQQKLDEAIEKNYQLQQKQVYLMMEIEKKQVQFRQLQKQVKKKISSIDISQNFSISDTTHSQGVISDDLTLGHSLVSDEILENRELKQNLDKLKKKNRQTERQKNRLQRKLQKVEFLQLDKRKLEKMVIDAHESRIQELFLLISALSQVNIEQSQKPQQRVKQQNNQVVIQNSVQ